MRYLDEILRAAARKLDWFVATVGNFSNVAGCVAALFCGTVTSCRGRVSAKPFGPETFDTIRDYTAKPTRSRSGKNLHSFCGQVQRGPKGNPRNRSPLTARFGNRSPRFWGAPEKWAEKGDIFMSYLYVKWNSF